MDNKKILGLIIGIVVLIIIIISTFLLAFNTKSKQIKLDKNYKSLIGIKVDSDIILVINKKNKVSNILFLNKKSVDTLANQKIEGNTIEKAIELIVDKLKNKNEFDNGKSLYLINYKNDSIYRDIEDALNKEFVVYGVNNQIVKESNSLDNKLNQLKLNSQQAEIKKLDSLYKLSINNLKKYEN